MDDISGAAVAALVSMVAFGWVLHVRDEEPGEAVLFISMLLGLFLGAEGRAGWVPWLWFGTLVLYIGFYAVEWTRGWRHPGPNPTDRDALNRHDYRRPTIGTSPTGGKVGRA